MRIEYSGTLLEQVLELKKSRPIDFVYLNIGEFYSSITEAEQAGIIDSSSAGDWFTLKDCDIVFYIDRDA